MSDYSEYLMKFKDFYRNTLLPCISGPELIPTCKETQLIRFQSKVVGLVPPAKRHSMRIINLGKPSCYPILQL